MSVDRCRIMLGIRLPFLVKILLASVYRGKVSFVINDKQRNISDDEPVRFCFCRVGDTINPGL